MKKLISINQMRQMPAMLLAFMLLVMIVLPYGGVRAEAAGGGEPVVIHATWQAAPGDVIDIHGGGLNGPDVEVKALPLSSGLPLDPANASVSLQLLKAEDQLIQAVLPVSAPADAYAVWVATSQGISEPFWFNRAEPFWISDTTAYIGQQIRLFGRNFLNPVNGSASGPSITLVNKSNGNRIPAAVKSADAYTIDFKVPLLAALGEYQIEVSNGAGDAAGKVLLDNDQSLNVIMTNMNAVSLELTLGLSVSWLTEIPVTHFYPATLFGAKGDGATDDTAAIQAALDKAEAKGGGIVFLPKGTYSFSSLSIPDRTLLIGSGKDKTNLVYNGADAPDYPRSILPRESFTVRTYGEAQKLIYSDNEYAGVANLKITSDEVRPQTDDRRRIHGYVAAIAFLGTARPSNDNYGSNPIPPDSHGYLVKNVDVEVADGTGAAVFSAGTSVIENSEFHVTHGGLEGSNALLRYRDNEISNMMRPATYTGGRTWYEGNAITGIDYETYVGTVGFRWNESSGAIEHRYGDFSQLENYLANNTTAGVFGSATGNEGEGYLWQGQSRLKYSRVTSAGEQSLSDTASAFTSAYIGKQVTITAGAGLGQQRMITGFSATELELDQPWSIQPDATSVYTVDVKAATHNIVVNNTLGGQTNKGGIMFYTKDYDNIIDGNTLLHTGGIWLAANQQNNGVRADYSYFTTVKNNILSGSSKPGHGQGNTLAIGPGVDGGIVATPDNNLPSVGVLGNEIRNNDLTALGPDFPYNSTYEAGYVTRSGIVVSTPGNIDFPMAQGLILQGNKVREAYAGAHLANSSYHTVLADNDFDGNGVPVEDSGSHGTILWQNGEQLPYLAASRANQQLDGTTILNWETEFPAPSYRISRSPSANGPFTELTTVTGSTYQDNSADGLPYYYQLTSLNSAGEEGASAVIQAQLHLSQIGAYDTSGRSFELAVANEIAYVADRDSIQILNVADPAHVQPIGSLTLGTSSVKLFLDGNRLYATDGGKLYVLDVSDPQSPVVLGSKAVQTAGEVQIHNGLAYVARGTNGIGIYDVSSPASIAQVKSITGLGNVGSIAFSGDYAYLAASSSGVSILDVSTPATAAVVGSYTDIQYSARDIAVRDGLAYVADSTNAGDGGLLVLDVSDPAAPTYLSQMDTDSAPVDINLVGPYAILSGYRNQMVVASVADPLRPMTAGQATTPNNSVFDSAAVGNLIYVANSNNGISVFEVD